MKNFKKIYVADFETTVDPDNCYVWSATLLDIEKIESEEVEIFGSIEEFMQRLQQIKENSVIYFHNLKFDGTFILDYLLRNKKWVSRTTEKQSRVKTSQLLSHQFQYTISDKGQWYKIELCCRTRVYIEIRDSLKLLPFSLEKLCKDFKVKHQKTKMQYDNKYSLSDCTEKDIEYIKNDVLGLAECLQHFKSRYELNQLTIGATCLQDFKENNFPDELFLFGGKKDLFVPLEKQKLKNSYLFKCDNQEEFIRKTYRGGFCYVAPQYAEKEIKEGCVLDVNSLYPYVMYSREYPTRHGFEVLGNFSNYVGKQGSYYFCTIEVNNVKLKKNMLPTIQIKNDLRFKANEWIKEIKFDYPIQLWLTKTDYERFIKHYNIGYMKHIGAIVFHTEKGIFNKYIDKHMEVKKNSVGADRTIAKLFLNNLYGKMATSRKTNYKMMYIDEQDKLKYKTVISEELKKSVNIAIGSAITAYARDVTFTAAQENYKYFCYADTDSIHCCCPVDKIKGVKIDDKELGFWANEANFTEAIYLRQKTYAEKINNEWCVTGCGMNKDCKNEIVKLLNAEGIGAFKRGVEIAEGKTNIKLVKGGTVIQKTTFTIK